MVPFSKPDKVLSTKHHVGQEEILFRVAVAANPDDDTAWLVYADWLEENDRPEPAARCRWWMATRIALREGVRWDKCPASALEVKSNINRINAEWVRRLYVVAVIRLIRSRYAPLPEWGFNETDATLAVAERFALGLASREELEAIWSVVRSSIPSGPLEELGDIWSTAESITENGAWSAVLSASRIATHVARGRALHSFREELEDVWRALRSVSHSAAEIISSMPDMPL